MFLLVACVPPKPVDGTVVDTSPPEPGVIEASSLVVTGSDAWPTQVDVVAELTEAAATRITCTAVDEAEEVHVADIDETAAPSARFYGLLPETEYRCAIALPGEGPLASTGVRTGAWTDLPEMAVEGDLAAMDGVYTLVNNGPICDTNTSQQVWIVDPEGRARWGFTIPEVAAADIDARYLGNNRVLIGGGNGVPGRGDGVIREMTFDGTVSYERTDPISGIDYNHSAELLDTGELLSIVWQPNTGYDGNFFGFGIERIDVATGLPNWDWNSQIGVDAGALTEGARSTDHFHANAVQWFPDDPEGPSYWVSLAQPGQVIRIDAETDEVSWVMGNNGDFLLYDEAGGLLDASWWFQFQHAITVGPSGDGLLLRLHDNGYLRGSSRLLDLQVDVAARTAQVVWQWTEADWVERAGGDYDVLPTGHRLATQGHCTC
jgi:hypothetical protein